MTSFSEQLKAYNRKYEARLRAVSREAVQDTIEIALVPRGDGGRLRILTGFLRASNLAAIGNMPSGPTTNERGKTYAIGSQASGEPVSVTLLRWDPNKEEKFFWGFTANYARPREYHDGFLRGATEMWDVTVEKAARRVRARLS